MPVQKFRDVAEMPAPEALPQGPEIARRLRAVWGAWSRLTRGMRIPCCR